VSTGSDLHRYFKRIDRAVATSSKDFSDLKLVVQGKHVRRIVETDLIIGDEMHRIKTKLVLVARYNSVAEAQQTIATPSVVEVSFRLKELPAGEFMSSIQSEFGALASNNAAIEVACR
jgi:hypothetical protein